jgi:hypothetical protein
LLAHGLNIAQIRMLGQKPMSAGWVWATVPQANLDLGQRGRHVGFAGLKLF